MPVIRPLALYTSKAWTTTSTQEDMIKRWERKFLRRIYGGVLDAGMWRMRTNAELYDLYKEPDIVIIIKQGRIRWARTKNDRE